MPPPKVVTNIGEVEHNIANYQDAIAKYPALARGMPNVRGWYASRTEIGEWIFAPSKFVGYKASSAEKYIKESTQGGDRDGGQTEKVLRTWFQEVEQNTRLGEELFQELRLFLSRHDKKPNKIARINVAKELIEPTQGLTRSPAARRSLLERITSNPEICGGRPVIRGTRMRVVDILEAFAHGATRQELLKDFDYLSDDDIAAALLYAARSADHRVLRTG